MRKTYIFFLLLTTSLLCGCGVTSFVLHPFGPKESSLKKRILVARLVDQAGFGPQIAKSLHDMLIDGLSATKKVLLFNTEASTSGTEATREASYGVRVDKRLLEKARKQGMNAVLLATISPIEREEKLKGIWPLRSAVAYYQIAVVLNLIDAQSGTVIFSHVESGGINIDLGEEEFTDRKWIREEMVRKILPKLIKNSVKPIEEALASEPWEGRILSVDHRIKINAGADVGLKAGQEFEVYGGSEIVKAKSGRRFLVSWKKIGKIRVTEVGETTSFAVPIQGKGFKQGQRIVSIN